MKKRKAIFTYARNEALYFPLWLKHHLKSFSKDDIFVLDNDTCDGSIESAINNGFLLKENVFPISCAENFTNQWLNDEASKFQHQLLNKYDWVVLAEVDELIAINPNHFLSWEDFLINFENSCKPFCRALGYDVVHDLKNEPALDLSKPILAQRSKARLWRPELNGGKMLFSKPILSKVPVAWRAGGHDLYHHADSRKTPLKIEIEEALLLFHLNMFDLDLCTQRRSTRVPSGQQQIGGDRLWVGQQLINEINSYLNSTACVHIPSELKNIF